MYENKSTQPLEEICEADNIEYKKIGNTTYTVVSNYTGKSSLLDIIKSSIKRDIEGGNY